MYFWKIDQLKSDLKAGPLPQKEQLKYLLAFVVCSCLLPIFHWAGINFWDKALDVQVLVLSILGTLYCFRVNGGAKGDRFVERYLSLGFVLAVRLGILFFFPVVVGYGIVVAFADPAIETTYWPDLIIDFVFFSLYFGLFGRAIRQVR